LEHKQSRNTFKVFLEEKLFVPQMEKTIKEHRVKIKQKTSTAVTTTFYLP